MNVSPPFLSLLFPEQALFLLCTSFFSSEFIGSYAFFFDCAELKHVDLSSTVITSTEDNKFTNCVKCGHNSIHCYSINQNDGLKMIAFQGCSRFKKIDIPFNVTSTGMDAFVDCNTFIKHCINWVMCT